jgi:hypothetical protein
MELSCPNGLNFVGQKRRMIWQPAVERHVCTDGSHVHPNEEIAATGLPEFGSVAYVHDMRLECLPNARRPRRPDRDGIEHRHARPFIA